MLPTARFAMAGAALALAALAASCIPAARAPGDARARTFGKSAPPPGQVFTFNNDAEPQTIDPSVMAGQPDGRVARILFEGLTVPDPQTLEPRPGQAYRWEVSADGRVYTFHLRPGLAWSDGTPLTARDFEWTWARVLDPATASRNAGLLDPIAGALERRRDGPHSATPLGIAAPDDSTFVVRLSEPTAYFLFLTQYYTFMPVPRHVIARWGAHWTAREHLVGNGPFRLAYWRPGDRFEFTPNPRYWDARQVRLEKIVCYPIDDLNTSTNLYKAGVIDWNPSGNIPSQFVPYMRGFADFRSAPYQGTFYFCLNVTRPPLDNAWLRRALACAIDRDAIANQLLKKSRLPWDRFAPRGYPGYEPPAGLRYDPAYARQCLARAGFSGGRGLRPLTILFNTSEDNGRICEAVQAMWARELGIHVALANMEFGSYMQAASALQYDIARRSWIGDYLDPNTFLATMVGGDGNNRTGWSDPRYDALLRRAAIELDPARRMALLRDAEALLLDQAPVIPIMQNTTTELVKSYVRGMYSNALDTHLLTHVWIDHGAGRALAERRP